MKFGQIETAHPTLVIAEIGNNHEGSFAAAQELVGRAAESGADVVKFQTFRTEQFVAKVQTERFARLKKFELTYDQFATLAKQAHDAGILFMSTPLDLESARFLAGVVDIIKIASGDNDCFPLLEEAAASRKPLIVSTGLATEVDVNAAVSCVRRRWSELDHDGALGLLHCVTAYPVEPAAANLAAIRTMVERYAHQDIVIGYSDHTIGPRASVLAVALGARVIEKHFTLDRNYSDFRDHQLSADPTMMRQMISEVREAEVLLGSGTKAPHAVELASIEAIRRSIGAARDLRAGEVLDGRSLVWLRPGTGFRPWQERAILGRRLKRDVEAGSVFGADDFE
jgi:sialic acid synthase SpsE